MTSIISKSLQRATVTIVKRAFLISGRRISSTRPPSEGMARMIAKPKTYLIVGLGNEELPATRHSVGMRVVDRLAQSLNMSWRRDIQNCVGCVSTTQLTSDVKIVLLKPKMPMNVNGTSVARTASYFEVDPENVYLVHDDIDKSLGEVYLKESGGACGHNGVRSVINSLNTDEVARIRIGIDRPERDDQVRDYLLEEFSASENESLDSAVDDCLHALADHLATKSGVELREPLKVVSETT